MRDFLISMFSALNDFGNEVKEKFEDDPDFLFGFGDDGSAQPSADCRRVTVHRNNRHYGFVIGLCAMILDLVLPDENGTGNRFRDFSKDHQAMAKLFEAFVRNFYRRHDEECGVSDVGGKTIAWDGTPSDEHSSSFWPEMKSDICLKTQRAPLVIDCKFYSESVKTTKYGSQRISSGNLYQIFTYAQNMAARPGWSEVEGLLLYAETGTPVNASHTVCGRLLRVATVDLNLEWPQIHRRLVELVKSA